MNETMTIDRTIGTVFVEPREEAADVLTRLATYVEAQLEFLVDRHDLRHNHGMNTKARTLKVTITLEE